MFKVYLVNHSHIDIGYTERQERITEYHADFLRQAVDCSLDPKRETYKDTDRFRYTVEGFWEVEQYLKKYGEEGKNRLLKAIRLGAIELTAGYLHLAELLNYDNLSHTLDYTRDFIKENGLDTIDTALSCDVNGFSWGFADALREHGINHLCTCINTHHGDSPFSTPFTPFWWESPKGNRVMVWNGPAYHKANLLGIMPPMSPGGDPGVPGMEPDKASFHVIENSDIAYKKLCEMRDSLKSRGYQFDFTLIMGSGLYTDNSPVSDDYCRILKEFNEKHGDEIQIISCKLSDYFKELEKYSDSFPVCPGDWNDWWTDGTLSTPSETTLFRNAQRVASLVKKLDPEQKTVTPEEHEEISNTLILYAEHTWGHSGSYSNPYTMAVAQLDARKANLSTRADILASKAYDKLLYALGDGEFRTVRPFRYYVYNPDNEKRADVAYLPADFWENYLVDGARVRVLDGEGREYPCQLTGALRGFSYACTVTLEPKEKKLLYIELDKTGEKTETVRNVPVQEGVFENPWYKLSYGERGVSSIIWKETGEELIDKDSRALGEPVYQLFPGGKRSDAAGFGYAARKKPAMELHGASLSSMTIKEQGPVFTHLLAEYSIKGTVHYGVHFYLFNELPKIRMNCDIAKELVLDPEGLYTALPFDVNGGHWYIDKPGAFFRPGEQLPRGCCDYYSFYRGTVLSGENTNIAVNILDTPLLTVKDIKLWDFTRDADDSGTVYAWITNNKWETNFRVQCAGCLRSRYVIEPYTAGKNTAPSPNKLENNEHDFVVVRE